MPSPYILAWKYRLKVFRETVTTANFWILFLGIIGALVVWFYLLYLGIKYLDTSLGMHYTFCISDEQRNKYLLAIILLTPLFMVGLIGVIDEWMTVMNNRRHKRKSNYKPLVVYSILLQVSALLIFIALQC